MSSQNPCSKPFTLRRAEKVVLTLVVVTLMVIENPRERSRKEDLKKSDDPEEDYLFYNQVQHAVHAS